MDNERIQGWFETDELKEAFLGDGKYRIPDVTYRDKHDRILVMSQLFRWAQKSNTKNATQKLENALKDLLPDHFSEAIDVILCYFIIKQNENTSVNVDFQGIKNELISAIKLNGTKIVTVETLRSQIVEISKYIPWIIQ